MLSAVRITSISGKGRGAIATRRIKAGECVECAPILLVKGEDIAHIHRSVMFNYMFDWPEPGRTEETEAIAFGVVSLLNHSARPNAKAERDFTAQTLCLIALTSIEAGEEVTIDYGNDLWFTPAEE